MRKLKRKEFGEVLTPVSLVNDMLDTLPKQVWSNPDLKWLDPCCGENRIFLIEIYKRLLINFSKEKIESMLFGCEIQEFDYNNDEYALNVYTGSFLEKGFDNHSREKWKIDGNFDVIVMNPPYQSAGSAREAKSIYHLFVSKSVNISNITLMITPSKWFSNPNMCNFRNDMINKYGLKELKHFDDASKIFGKDVEIKGGVSYFLLKKDYTGNVLLNNVSRDFKNKNIIFLLDVDSIIEKIKTEKSISKLMFTEQYFGVKNSDSRFLESYCENVYKCYVSSKNGYVKYIKKEDINLKNNINKYKVFLTSASGDSKKIGKLGRFFIGLPNEISSRSFIHFAFENEKLCENFISYLDTKFVRFLVNIKKQTQIITKECFSLVPEVDLSKQWTDFELYKLFNLSTEEIQLIENEIQP